MSDLEIVEPYDPFRDRTKADPGAAGLEPVLSVRDLQVMFKTDDGIVQAVNGVSFDVFPNEILGIVGESGSGKSVTSLAVLGLLPRTATVTGEITYRGEELLGAPEKRLQALRGDRIAMVFQDALAALNPVFRVGSQVGEAIKVHHPDVDRKELRERVVHLLDLVGIPDPAARANQYPHEYSGGMRQRAMIAMAIANDPDVLIADEPTTALDVTIQAQVLEVLERVQDQTNSAIILITHDLGVVAGLTDRVMVMYAGRPVELAGVDDLFYDSRHPYTLGLLASLPRLEDDSELPLFHIPGRPPSLLSVPRGCAFHPRCPFAQLPEPCATTVPALRPAGEASHFSACHLAENMTDEDPVSLRARSADEAGTRR